MRLTTEFREAPAGAFTKAKHWNLCCHVDFSNEERAIIEQRGLHHLYLHVSPAAPPPGPIAYVGIGFIRPASKLLLIVAAIMIVVGFLPALNTLQYVGTWLLFIAIGLWIFSWWKEREADKRLTATEQEVSLGTLLSHPDFSIYAYTREQAQEDELHVRSQLSDLSSRIKAAVEIRSQTTYEL